MNGKVSKRPRRAQPDLLERYVTSFEPDAAISATTDRGYRLIGCTAEGYPLFEALKGSAAPGEVVYETPLFEEFIPETFH